MRIVFDILDAAVYGALLTEIMSKAVLGYTQMHRYIKILVAAKLLEIFTHSSKVYRTTEEGRIFLKKYRELAELLNGRFETIDLGTSKNRTSLAECVLTSSLPKKADLNKYRCRTCGQSFNPGETLIVRFLKYKRIYYHKSCFEGAPTQRF